MYSNICFYIPNVACNKSSVWLKSHKITSHDRKPTIFLVGNFIQSFATGPTRDQQRRLMARREESGTRGNENPLYHMHDLHQIGSTKMLQYTNLLVQYTFFCSSRLCHFRIAHDLICLLQNCALQCKYSKKEHKVLKRHMLADIGESEGSEPGLVFEGLSQPVFMKGFSQTFSPRTAWFC